MGILQNILGTNLTKKDAPQTMTNSRGKDVPIENIRPYDLAEDGLVADLFDQAIEASLALAELRENTLEKIQQHRETAAEDYGVKLRDSQKGNVTISAYDGKRKIEIRIAEFIDFGSSLSVAKELIDNCVNRWAEDSDPKIKTLITDAFQTDKHNRLNTKRILGLKQYDFEDDEWRAAMNAIDAAIRVTGKKSYIRFVERDDDGAETSISLNIANA